MSLVIGLLAEMGLFLKEETPPGGSPNPHLYFDVFCTFAEVLWILEARSAL